MTGNPIPREAGPMPTEPAAILALLAAGKLEQSCPRCGRFEAAHRYCSWCYRRMGLADWYRNNSAADREARRPTAIPVSVPPEYRDPRFWPESWGEYPYPRRPTPADSRPDSVSGAETRVAGQTAATGGLWDSESAAM